MQVAKYSSGRQINGSQNEISPSWGGGGGGAGNNWKSKIHFCYF